MRKLFHNKYILTILIFYAVWLAAIPVLFSQFLPLICENISYNSSYNIKIEKPRLYTNIIPIITIKADKISVANNNNSLNLANCNVHLRLLPLISKKIHIDSIKIADIDSDNTIQDDIELNKDLFLKLSRSNIECDKVSVKNFSIKLKQANTNQETLYQGKNVIYAKNARYLKVNLDSIIKISNITSTVQVNLFIPQNNSKRKKITDINLENFDIAPLGEFLTNYLPKDTEKVYGTIDLKTGYNDLTVKMKECAYINKDNAKSIIFPKELVINSEFDLNHKKLIIKNADIKADNIQLNISGTISNYLSKTLSEVNLNIRIDKSKIENFINMLPPFKTEDFDIYKLKKYKFFGDVLGNLSINGDIREPSVTGSIYINNGILIKPIPNAKGATIKLNFKGKYLNFDVLVPANKNEKVFVLGGVELYNVKYSDMRIWSTPNVDLALAEEKVVPLHEILNFLIGPVPIMDIKGIGHIDITVKGNRKLPHVWGAFNLKNATAYFYEIPDMILKNADAVLTFDDTNAEFKLQKGLLNNKDISINGTCNLSGKLDFDVKTENQELAKLYNMLQTSTMLEDIKVMLPKFTKIDGLANISMKVYGNIKDIKCLNFNKNFFVNGNIELQESSLSLQGITLNKIKGLVKFDNANADIEVASIIGKSPLKLKASVKNNIADASVYIPYLNLSDIIDKSDKFFNEIAKVTVEISADYKGKINNIEPQNISLIAKILKVSQDNKLNLSNGKIILKNGNLSIKNLNGTFVENKSSFDINLIINNLFTSPMASGKVKLNDFELKLLNSITNNNYIPSDIRNILHNIQFDKGKINLKADISNNTINASTNIGGVALTYLPMNLPLQVVNGSIYIKKNYLVLNMINIIAEGMPILIDGGIHDIFDKQFFDIYINSKPKQEFIDKYFNNYRIYPLKIKGDIIYWVKLKGTKNDFLVNSKANLAKNSSIYYMGGTVGDIENSISLDLSMNVIKQNILKIKEFSYDKLITSQGNKSTELNMLKVFGNIEVAKDDIIFDNLKIKTTNPTDARIFNVIFRKPNIKQGQFTSDLKFNGKLSSPNLKGVFHIVETNIPFWDTTMKNISVVFKDKTIELLSTGEVLGNDIMFKGTLKNKLSTPYYVENAELYTKMLDLNYLADKFKTSQVDEASVDNLANFNIKNIIVEKLSLSVDEIKLRNLTAKNVQAVTSLNKKHVFKIDKFNFKVAEGTLDGNFKYDMNNNNIGLNLKATAINANDLSIALFDLHNQIYGDLTGNVKLNCEGETFNHCMQTLSGTTEFNVIDGKMPKLGSLEYLLKAGNLLKGGITSITMNSIIDILSPLKTGEFTDIYGNINIDNGITNNIEISTKGKDLSLFISGQYNFASSDANMEVLGLLSTKLSTMFGPLGNVSINTLFNRIPGVDLSKDSKILERINKIPGIELSKKSYRKFIAIIQGDINSDNYVSSFSWIN